MLRGHLSLFVLLTSLLFMTACTDTGTSSGTTTTSSDTPPVTETEEVPETPTIAAPDCTIAGEVMEGNQVWLQSRDVLAVIKADETTTVEGFGPGHRILEILDGRSCDQLFQTSLPENTSPDYPYYIAEVQYNNISNIIGIQGYYNVLICDLDDNYKLTELKPEFFDEREYDDPQSGMVQRMEVWENYLLGYAQDIGAFAFDLTDRAAPKAALPFAEWQNDEDGRYHSLFLLPTEDGTQAIMPFYDAEADNFQLHPIFDAPENISDQVAKSARNNQFLVLRKKNEGRTPLAINLGTRELMELPADVASKGTQDILKWMRTQ